MFLEIEQVDKSIECDTFLTFLPQTTITQRVVHVSHFLWPSASYHGAFVFVSTNNNNTSSSSNNNKQTMASQSTALRATTEEKTTDQLLTSTHKLKLKPPTYNGEYSTVEKWKYKFTAYMGLHDPFCGTITRRSEIHNTNSHVNRSRTQSGIQRRQRG